MGGVVTAPGYVVRRGKGYAADGKCTSWTGNVDRAYVWPVAEEPIARNWARAAEGHVERQKYVPTAQDLYRGLLLALRAHRHRFNSHGPKFHEAFSAVLHVAITLKDVAPLAEEMQQRFDPVFGVYRAAEDMILEGMAALLLQLESPRNEVAVFDISKAQAEEELGRGFLPDLWRRLGKVFHEAL